MTVDSERIFRTSSEYSEDVLQNLHRCFSLMSRDERFISGLWIFVKMQLLDYSHFLAFSDFTKPKLHLDMWVSEWRFEPKETSTPVGHRNCYKLEVKKTFTFVIRTLLTWFFWSRNRNCQNLVSHIFTKNHRSAQFSAGARRRVG